MISAGTKKFTNEGRNKAKNSENLITPFCQTIKVVMSPNGLNAPPALAATTTLMQERVTNFDSPLATAMITAHMTKAVVKLSATGEIKKAHSPVNQKIIL